MFGKSLILIASTLAPIIRRLVTSAMANDEEEAKKAFADLLIEAKREAVRRRFK